jgi:hypothetical protein
MAELRAPGLAGDWLNAWVAALGVTVLLDGCRLRWTEDVIPVAVCQTSDGVDLADRVGAALGSEAYLRGLAISNTDGRFPHNVSLSEFRAAVDLARSRSDFSLSSSVTDLVADAAAANLPHSRFDPSAPKGETLWDRLLRCRRLLGDPDNVADSVRATFAGMAKRQVANGLGFDFRRITAGSQAGQDKYVDPAIECLAFLGLALFPVRGNGLPRGANPGRSRGAQTRGWRRNSSGRDIFLWPTWTPALDRWAIDALLGMFFSGGSDVPGLGRVFEVVEYRRRGDLDPTSGYASRPVR